jgi:hypothetical protein
MSWIDISDILTPEGAKRLKVGQVMMFDFEGSRNDLKIMRKHNKKVWAKQIVTHHPDEVIVTQKNAKGKDVSRRLSDMS